LRINGANLIQQHMHVEACLEQHEPAEAKRLCWAVLSHAHDAAQIVVVLIDGTRWREERLL
jgi:hypothetical protein